MPGQERDPDRLPVAVHGAGRPLLLLHGFGLRPRTYRETLYLLAERRRVLCPAWLELPGRWTFDGVLAALQRDLEDRDADQLTVLGHSYGAGLGLALAARRPDLVRELVLADSAGLTGRWQLARRAIPGPFVWRLATYQAAIDFLRNAHRNRRSLARAGWYGFVRDESAATSLVANADIACHVLWAERDTLLQQDVGRAFAEQLDASFTVVSDPAGPGPVDHDWVYRHPHLVLRALEDCGVLDRPADRRRDHEIDPPQRVDAVRSSTGT